MAQKKAAWLIRVERGSLGSSMAHTGCSMAQLGCSVSQMVVRWVSVRQAPVIISDWHLMKVLPTELTVVKIWRWSSANVSIVQKKNKCKKSGIRPPYFYYSKKLEF
jgi:hypothetical protein